MRILLLAAFVLLSAGARAGGGEYFVVRAYADRVDSAPDDLRCERLVPMAGEPARARFLTCGPAGGPEYLFRDVKGGSRDAYFRFIRGRIAEEAAAAERAGDAARLEDLKAAARMVDRRTRAAYFSVPASADPNAPASPADLVCDVPSEPGDSVWCEPKGGKQFFSAGGADEPAARKAYFRKMSSVIASRMSAPAPGEPPEFLEAARRFVAGQLGAAPPQARGGDRHKIDEEIEASARALSEMKSLYMKLQEDAGYRRVAKNIWKDRELSKADFVQMGRELDEAEAALKGLRARRKQLDEADKRAVAAYRAELAKISPDTLLAADLAAVRDNSLERAYQRGKGKLPLSFSDLDAAAGEDLRRKRVERDARLAALVAVPGNVGRAWDDLNRRVAKDGLWKALDDLAREDAAKRAGKESFLDWAGKTATSPEVVGLFSKPYERRARLRAVALSDFFADEYEKAAAELDRTRILAADKRLAPAERRRLEAKAQALGFAKVRSMINYEALKHIPGILKPQVFPKSIVEAESRDAGKRGTPGPLVRLAAPAAVPNLLAEAAPNELDAALGERIARSAAERACGERLKAKVFNASANPSLQDREQHDRARRVYEDCLRDYASGAGPAGDGGDENDSTSEKEGPEPDTSPVPVKSGRRPRVPNPLAPY